VKSFTRTNLLLLLAVVALAVAPLLFVDGAFNGSDGQAQEMITRDHPEYTPWFSALYTLPSKEIESALFALQAALGAGVLGYYFGVARTRRKLAPPRD
jgi:cobalt/nickel transport protein